MTYQFEGLKRGAACSQANNAGLFAAGAGNPSVDSINGTAYGIQGRSRTYGIDKSRVAASCNYQVAASFPVWSNDHIN
ncbi:hypothetical protein CFB40_37100 [Burkholderia sp. AU31652]|nr:hypothetical protein CFB40_37100 [Burkholderia sp. AU31652]